MMTSVFCPSLDSISFISIFQDERFDQSVDSGTAFRHTTMLCMPVTHGARKPSKVLGVFQLVNKFDGLKFTRNDENFVEAFAIFCGMGINNVRMYEKTVVAMAKQQGGWIESQQTILRRCLTIFAIFQTSADGKYVHFL